MLLTIAKYAEITGETPAASAFNPAASAAQELLEDALGRRDQLEEADRTEQCRFYPDGTIYPMAVPLVSVEGGLNFFEDVVYGATPDATAFVGFFPPVDPPIVTLTYRGGFTSELGQENTAPEYMLHDLAWCAYNLMRPSAGAALAAAPAGSSSASSGDVSVSWGSEGAPASVAEVRAGWSRQTLRHRRRSP